MSPLKTDDDPLRTRAALAGAGFGFIFGAVGLLLGYMFGARGTTLIISAVVLGLVSGVMMFVISHGVSSGSANVIASFVYPSGRSSPYERSFSAHDALEAKGDVNGAIEAYEATLRAEPLNSRALRQAAELHARAGNPHRAAELLLMLRKQSPDRSDELYATQRLADLYLGSLGGDGDGRALVELRRIVERFPDTPEAEGAKVAIRRLKAERGHDDMKEP